MHALPSIIEPATWRRQRLIVIPEPASTMASGSGMSRTVRRCLSANSMRSDLSSIGCAGSGSHGIGMQQHVASVTLLEYCADDRGCNRDQSSHIGQRWRVSIGRVPVAECAAVDFVRIDWDALFTKGAEVNYRMIRHLRMQAA